ncbi:uncharacterized protein PSFLO_07720 [Pseudozyma flocculosa]|uniref:Uncharacterized protein n=1 Tax=Pseudozyma flocculosa TaxID=84751 RepID=A0A5C3FEY5_9BASI|nr:uncharacterized protein PSFLO_07720 [Pseudozyma flocculosa]
MAWRRVKHSQAILQAATSSILCLCNLSLIKPRPEIQLCLGNFGQLSIAPVSPLWVEAMAASILTNWKEGGVFSLSFMVRKGMLLEFLKEQRKAGLELGTELASEDWIRKDLSKGASF